MNPERNADRDTERTLGHLSKHTSEHVEQSALRRRLALTGTGALVLGGVTPVSALVVTDSADAVNGSTVVTDFTDDPENPAAGSLRDVIDNSAPGDVITFDLDDSETQIIQLKASLLIPHPLAIERPSDSVLIIDGGGEDEGGFSMFVIDPEGAFDADSAESVTISGITLADGFTPSGDGGAVNCQSIPGASLHVEDVSFTGNSAGRGGAIFWEDCGALTVTDSGFVGNLALEGGAISGATAETVTITGSAFSGNRSAEAASAVLLEGFSLLAPASADLDAADLEAADTLSAGYLGRLIVEDTRFEGNVVEQRDPDDPDDPDSASVFGALGAFGFSEISVTGSQFFDNGIQVDEVQYLDPSSAYVVGGGAFLVGETVEVTEGSFDGNTSVFGGALAVYGLDVSITDSYFFDNCGALMGGAIGAYAFEQLDISGSEFRSNQSGFIGGAVGVGFPYFVFGGPLALDGREGESAFDALARTGPLNGDDDVLGTVTISGSSLESNQSGLFGGAVALAGPFDLTVSDSSLTENQAVFGAAIATPFPFDLFGDLDSTATGDDEGRVGSADVGGLCDVPFNPFPTGPVVAADADPRNGDDGPPGWYDSIGAARVTIDGSTISDNLALALGSVVAFADEVTVSESRMSNNSSSSGDFEDSGRVVMLAGADDVTVSGSTFDSNEGTALVATTFLYNPDPLESAGGRLQISDSVFVDNEDSGVIARGFETAEISGSTLSGNGALYSLAAAVLYSTDGSTLISNSTFADNQAPAALLVNTSEATVITTTITGTTADGDAPASGVVFGDIVLYDPDPDSLRDLEAAPQSPILTVMGSVISANGDDEVPEISIINGVPGILIEDPDDGVGDVELSIESSVVGSVRIDEQSVPVDEFGAGNVVTDDPQLGPLADNGGPELPGGFSLLTRLPGAGSPASGLVSSQAIDELETESGLDLEFDQRGAGFARVVDRGGEMVSDAGAVTVQTVGFVSSEPVRLFDSRAGSGPLEPGVPVAIPLSGVPDDAASVVLNVTVANAKGDGFVTVFPCGVDTPPTSNANFVGISTVAANVISAIGDDGAVCVSLGQVGGEVIVDLMGYFTAGAYLSMVPERVYDSRGGVGVIPAGETVRVRVPESAMGRVGGAGLVGREGGDGVEAAVVNVTVANANGDGFFTVWDCADPMPGTSNGNFVGVSTIANSVVTALNGDGELCVRLGQSDANVIVDLMGFVLSDSGYESLGADGSSGPQRVFDSRAGSARAARPDDDDIDDGLVAAGETVRVRLPESMTGRVGGAGRAGRVGGDGVGAAVVNVTVANANGDGFFTVWDCAGPVPGTSNGNFVGVSTIANSVVVGVEADEICVQLGQSPAHLIVDVFGSFPSD